MRKASTIADAFFIEMRCMLETPPVPVAAATWSESAATAAATTASAETSATAITAAATTWPVFGSLHDQRLFPQRNIVEAFDRVFCFSFVGHVHKAKSFAFAGFTIHHHFGGCDLPELFKNFFQFSVIQVVRKTSNEDFHVSAFRKSKINVDTEP